MNFRLIEYTMKKRRLIGAAALLFALVALSIVLLGDPKYKSRTLLMPPLEEGSEGLLSAWMSQMNLPSMVVPMTAGSTTAAVLVDILESRRLAEMVIGSEGLMEWYESDGMDDAVRNLRNRTSITTSVASGVIIMSVVDRDPSKARDVAEAYIEGLDSLSHMLQFTRAESMMEFVSGQIERYRGQVADSRKKLADFQIKNGLFDFEEQTRGAIDVAADLKVMAVVASIELDMLKQFSREDALELRRKEMNYRSLTEQLENLMVGDSSTSVFMPMSDLPELYKEHASLQREVEVNEKVLSFLLERYEDAGITRARNTPTVQIVDPPNVPEKKSGLAWWLVVVIAGAAGSLWATLMVGWWGWVSMRTRTGEEEKAFRGLVEMVERDISAIRKLLRI